jgi:hypothetical protein
MPEGMYDMLKRDSNAVITELPVTDVSRGNRGKIKKVHKQIYLPCKPNDLVFDIPCFVRGIPTTIILGSDLSS